MNAAIQSSMSVFMKYWANIVCLAGSRRWAERADHERRRGEDDLHLSLKRIYSLMLKPQA